MSSLIPQTVKFYREDLVQYKFIPNKYGILLNCWHDEINGFDMHPEDPPLKQGQVHVQWIDDMQHGIIPELDITLVDRRFRPGDCCKRNPNDLRSGIVTRVDIQARIEHVISGEPVEGWKTCHDLACRTVARSGDYVMYNDWIGQVVEVCYEFMIERATGHLVSVVGLTDSLFLGKKGKDLVSAASAHPVNSPVILADGEPHDTVVDAKPVVVAICWLAFNQSLSLSESQSKVRPKRFWSGVEASELTLLESILDVSAQVHPGSVVRVKDGTHMPVTIHGDKVDPTGQIAIQAYLVKQTKTSLSVLWQDGTRESVGSTELIPYLHEDECDCWPGEHIIWKGDNQIRSAVVQSVDAEQRTATILRPETSTMELVPLLELDPHGTIAPDNALMMDQVGVQLGELVFIHQEGETNGMKDPYVPVIGEVEPWVYENSISDGKHTQWQKNMVDIAADTVKKSAINNFQGSQLQHSQTSGRLIPWFGEVANLCLDGLIQVLHPDGTYAVYPMQRLTILLGGVTQLQDIWDAVVDVDAVSNEKRVDDADEMGVDDDAEVEPEAFQHFDDREEDDLSHSLKVTELDPVSSHLHDSAGQDGCSASGVAEGRHRMGDNPEWNRFVILSSAPMDHAFYGKPSPRPSRLLLSRLAREYRTLMNGLPDTILVRAYEDRIDLLRSLILGPDNTPYEDAPFIIDWQFGDNFPNTPPVAHFHSWTNGNGRVNPNLYEEGKVCLSILGTWAGDQHEVWSAARSSLLQALVSIQGLVLVKEPWYCEPAFEKMRGTPEGALNSRLYNEKAYILSRSFIRRALEVPIGSLEDEVHWMYYTNRRLDVVLNNARTLIEISRNQSQGTCDMDVAISRLTTGAIISLEKTMARLQELLDSKVCNNSGCNCKDTC